MMRKRFAFLGVLALVLVLVFPTRANAIDFMPKGVFYQGDVENGNYGAVVAAYNQYDAACYVLGKNPDSISANIKQKLSDPNYGGRFYEYAQSFFTQSGALEDVPAWVPTYIVWGSELMDLVLTDYQSVWYSTATKTLHDDALVDLVRILNGEDLGGGGSGSGSGDYYSVSVRAFDNERSDLYYTLTATNASFVSGEVVLGEGTTVISAYVNSPYYVSSGALYLSDGFVSVADNYISNGYDVVWAIDNDGIYLIYGHELSISFRQATSLDNGYYVFGSDGYVVFYRSPIYFDGTSVFCFSSLNATPTSSRVFRLPNTAMYLSGVNPSYSPVSAPPSGVWPGPSTPVTPTAPALPDPASPTVDTPVTPTVPAPVWPDITINIEPDPTPGTTPEGLDYTELLTRINDNLISIDSFARAINSNLNSLRSDLLAEFNGVIDSLRNIYSYLLTIDSVLENHCTHLRNKMEESAVFIANYMRTLIKWLADQLDFDDLTNVEAPDNSLLTTINEKLGGGTYEPNPIKDEQGYYQWLDDLWDRFLLGDNWQSSMGSISGSFNELKTRFPFSIPWDVVALFRLFVHDPVTPVFDLPLYFSSDGSTPVHVDLTPWDSVAAVVRPLVFVIFALKLALLSRDLLGGLGADKGGL